MSAGYLKKHYTSRGQPKQGFSTNRLAEDFRKRMIAAGRWRAADTNTYFCNVCGEYHAGRMGKAHRGRSRKAAKNTPRFLASQ